jgi:hypothetical protein
MLSGIVLAVTAIRTVEMAQVVGLSGQAPVWTRIIAVEAAIWVGWNLWAAALVPLLRMVIERPLARFYRVAAVLALVLAPALLVPVLASPVHWLMFGGGGTLVTAYLHMVRHNAVTNLLLGVTLVGVVHGYLSIQRARRLEVTAARLNTQLADAQLETLRAQLDPHFLFNALNSISVLARRGQVQDVDRMVVRLAGLLRHSLESSRAQLVTLRVELMALRHYLEIEQVRHGDRLVASVNVPEHLLELPVPSFLLQPLVENSIRHGMVDPLRPLQLEITAREEAGAIILTITDDGTGLQGAGDPRDGVGLGTTRARLAGLYGGGASLSLAPGPEGRGARVTIVVPGSEGARKPGYA